MSSRVRRVCAETESANSSKRKNSPSKTCSNGALTALAARTARHATPLALRVLIVPCVVLCCVCRGVQQH
jgi:hypothetical protein